MKKFTIISASYLLMLLTSFAQDSIYSRTWYKSEYVPPVYSQNLSFAIHGNYTRPIKSESLNNAMTLSDIISGYPTNWVSNYTSVEVRATSNGKEKKALSRNDVLSTEQKNILKTVDQGTNIVVKVKYKSKNVVTDEIVSSEVNASLMVVPKLEAEYIGGQTQMTKYFNENVINKIYESTPKEFQHGVVTFTVNENGEIVNTKISSTSGDAKTDRFLIESINKMPKWKPAENSRGEKVKQEFEFSVGNVGC